MNTVFLLLGSNIGDRVSSIKEATLKLEADLGEITNTSSYYETEPWGFQSNNFFLNLVLQINTKLSPSEVLSSISEIEINLGRKRRSNIYENRPIDIDILFFNDLHIQTDQLVIPHPKLHLRNFALIPANELASNYIHPVFKKRIKDLLKICSDDSLVRIIKQPITKNVNFSFAKDEI